MKENHHYNHMAKILQIPEAQLQQYRGELKAPREKKYLRIWESLLHKEAFQKKILAHRITLECPLHAFKGESISMETSLGSIGLDAYEAAKIVCMEFCLSKMWIEPIKVFITENKIILPSMPSVSYLNQEGPKRKQTLQLLYEGQEFKAYVYHDLYVSSFAGIHVSPRLVIEYDTDVLAKDASAIFAELEEVRSMLSQKYKDERTYTPDVLAFIASEKAGGSLSKDIVIKLKDTFPHLSKNYSLTEDMVNTLSERMRNKG